MLGARSQVLFNPGPVNIHRSIQENLFNVELCHRQPEFVDLMNSVRCRLEHVGRLPKGKHRLSLLHGSGTLAVEAAACNVVRGRVLVLDNGVYCRRIAAVLSLMDDTEVRALDAGVGRRPDLVDLEDAIRSFDPQWIAVVQHETMTGLLNPVDAIADLATKHGCRLFVDAVSSFGVHRLPPVADVACFNSNKCLESVPGIAGVFWASDLKPRHVPLSLDLAAHAEGIPITPNVQAFVALDIALDLLANEDRPARYERLARHVWGAGSKHFQPFLEENDRSHVLTSFRLGSRNSDHMMRRALDHGFVIYQGQGELRGEIFRVANMGVAMTHEIIDSLFELLAR